MFLSLITIGIYLKDNALSLSFPMKNKLFFCSEILISTFSVFTFTYFTYIFRLIGNQLNKKTTLLEMKKTLIITISVVILIILSITVYWNLPIEITRKSDIKFGNKVIQNIESYQETNHQLPSNNDWQTLEKLGLKKNESEKLSYTSDENGNYELVYLDGFDGPYLMWNSQEKKWTIDFAKIHE